MLTAAQWGRAPFSADPMLGPIRDVFVHHTASIPSGDFAADLRRLDQMAHSEGYAAIEYHFLHTASGERAEGRGWGVEGGATLGWNDDDAPGARASYAMCALGYFHPPYSHQVTAQLVDAIATTIAEGIQAGHIAADCEIRGHRDVRSTACPGDALYAAVPAIRARVNELLAPQEVEVTPEECRQIVRDEVPGLVRRVVREEVTTIISDLKDWLLRKGSAAQAPFRDLLVRTSERGSARAIKAELRSPDGARAADEG